MDTIFASATPIIKSGIAIIRISGPKTIDIVKKITKKEADKIQPRKAIFSKFFDPKNNEIIDEGLLLYFKAPNSFTGEDVAEFHIHGSKAVISNFYDTLLSLNDEENKASREIRIAEAGEFSKRAFENNKMDLTQAEGLVDLIEAETNLQAKQAIKQMQGQIKHLMDNWREQLIAIMANVEAYIDFPDEEIPESVVNDISNQIKKLKLSINKLLKDSRVGERIREGVYVTIIGAPNAGKSSLINALTKRDIAIVSDIAGTTRDVLEAHLDIKGLPITLADTAGLREKSGKIEEEGIRRAKHKAKMADLKIAIFDIKKIESLDKSTLNLVDNNTIVIINKVDLLPEDNDIIKKLENNLKLPNHQAIFISTKTEAGIEELITELEKRLQNYINPSFDYIITRARHRDLITGCLDALEDFDLNKEIEICAEELRVAANCLGRVTGNIDVEDILDQLFSSFCIGK